MNTATIFRFLFFVLAGGLWAGEMEALVVLEADASSGSGFLMREAGKTYVVSNLHVLMGGKPDIKTLSGGRLKAGALEVAKDRDLGRIEVNGDALAVLPPRAALPSVGSPVRVLGNSDGAGVATVLPGKVLGVGPDLLEIDARFVQGNSGSPIVDGDGHVLAVASFATRNVEVGNWLKRDSRFNQVRRFGYRLNGVEWNRMSWEDLGKRVRLLEDLEKLCFELFLMKYTDTFRDEKGLLTYSVPEGRKKYGGYPMFASWMGTLATSLNREADAYLSKAMNQTEQERAMQLTRDLRQQSGLGINREQQRVVQRAIERRENVRAVNTVRALNYILLRDPKTFQSNPAVQRLGKGVRARLIHDHWGSDFLKERAENIYQTFLRISNGQILEAFRQP